MRPHRDVGRVLEVAATWRLTRQTYCELGQYSRGMALVCEAAQACYLGSPLSDRKAVENFSERPVEFIRAFQHRIMSGMRQHDCVEVR